MEGAAFTSYSSQFQKQLVLQHFTAMLYSNLVNAPLHLPSQHHLSLPSALLLTADPCSIAQNRLIKHYVVQKQLTHVAQTEIGNLQITHA